MDNQLFLVHHRISDKRIAETYNWVPNTLLYDGGNMPEINTKVVQISDSASEGTARNHSIFIDRPESKDGTDKGPMGGEYFLMGLGGCFMSNLLAAIRARKTAVSGIKVEVSGSIAENPTRFSAVSLKVSGNYSDKEQMIKLMTIAERGCLVANSIKDAIQLTFTVI